LARLLPWVGWEVYDPAKEISMKPILGIVSAVALLCANGCAHPQSKSPENKGAFDVDDEETVAPRACTPSTTEVASLDGRVASFTNAANDFAGAIVSYPVDSSTAPTATVSKSELHITTHVPIADKAQYVGVALAFPKCTDASRFKGVSFSIRGTYKGCTMQYGTTDVAHADRHNKATYATGTQGAYPPQTRLESSAISQVPQTMRIAFSDSTIPGRPRGPVDPTKLTALIWQFTVSPAAIVDDDTKACDADVGVGDIKFY
jgi:hypothetical protein